MISAADSLFKEWAKDSRCGSGGPYLGIGDSPLWAIMEGKGQPLPRAPKGSGPKLTVISQTSLRVDRFVSGLHKSDKTILKIFYIDFTHTIIEKCQMLGLSRRGLYDRITFLQRMLLVYLHETKKDR